MRTLLFSVGAADCEWSYTRGRGAGGQKKNKTSSAVHCSHEPSGAHGYAEDSRSQLDNRRLAFERMAGTPAFKTWHRMEVARRTGEMARIDADVARCLTEAKVERRENGVWTEWREAA